jgi:hypothetical protein
MSGEQLLLLMLISPCSLKFVAYFLKKTPTQSCISFMFQQVQTLQKHFDMTHYSQRNFEISYIIYVENHKFFSYCQSVHNKLFWTNVNYIAIDQRFLRQILLFSCVGMTPTIPCFSSVFKRDSKEFDMTYYIQIFKIFLSCGNKKFIECKLTFLNYSAFPVIVYFLIWHTAGNIITHYIEVLRISIPKSVNSSSR